MVDYSELAPDELRIIRSEHEARMRLIGDRRAAAELVRRWALNGQRSGEAREVLIEVGRILGVIPREEQPG